jgi:translation initiation factor IF-3
MPHEAKNFLFL